MTIPARNPRVLTTIVAVVWLVSAGNAHAGDQVAASEEPELFGERPTIEALDLDADRIPEIVVSVLGGRGRRSGLRTRIHRWNGAELAWLKPQPEDAADDMGAIREPSFADVNGDGDLDLLEMSDTYGVSVEFVTDEEAEAAALPVPDRSHRIWHVTPEGLVLSDMEAAYVGIFTIAKTGKPTIVSETFKADPGDYIISAWISSKSTAVDASEIRMNGATIFKPDVFRNKTRATHTVSLKAANTLSLELRGAYGHQVWIMIARRHSP